MIPNYIPYTRDYKITYGVWLEHYRPQLRTLFTIFQDIIKQRDLLEYFDVESKKTFECFCRKVFAKSSRRLI